MELTTELEIEVLGMLKNQSLLAETASIATIGYISLFR